MKLGPPGQNLIYAVLQHPHSQNSLVCFTKWALSQVKSKSTACNIPDTAPRVPFLGPTFKWLGSYKMRHFAFYGVQGSDLRDKDKIWLHLRPELSPDICLFPIDEMLLCPQLAYGSDSFKDLFQPYLPFNNTSFWKYFKDKLSTFQLGLRKLLGNLLLSIKMESTS